MTRPAMHRPTVCRPGPKLPQPRSLLGALLGVVVCSCLLSAASADVIVTGIGRYDFVDAGGSGADELSGLTYAGGNSYYAVSDGQAKLFTMTIDVNPATGAITSASIGGSPLQLNDAGGSPLAGSDREGVALAGPDVWIANENGPELSRHSLATGNRLQQITITSHAQLGVFNNTASNRSWESLARRSDDSQTWTANEEALSVDGLLATTSAGTVVRLQKFDAGMTPVGQWAYETEPINGSLGTGTERSGVVDLLALDTGELLVMERAAGIGFKIGLYLVDFTGATDVSQVPLDDGLLGESYTPVGKTELWSGTFLDTTSNFEGLALGPLLGDGSQSLILIRDNGSGTSQSLYALKLVPEPSTLLLAAMAGMMLVARFARRRPRARA